MKPSDNQLLTVRAAADRLGIAYKTCWTWVYERKLPVTRMGRCVRIPSEALESLIDEHTVPARPEPE